MQREYFFEIILFSAIVIHITLINAKGYGANGEICKNLLEASQGLVVVMSRCNGHLQRSFAYDFAISIQGF